MAVAAFVPVHRPTPASARLRLTPELAAALAQEALADPRAWARVGLHDSETIARARSQVARLLEEALGTV